MTIDCPNEEYLAGARAAFNSATIHIANYLSADNARFDHAHFCAVVRGERELTSRPPR